MTRANDEIRQEVQEIIDRLTAAMQLRNIDIFMKVFSTLSGTSSIGVQRDDINVGNAAIRSSMDEMFKDLTELSLKFGWNSINSSVDGNVAWMNANSKMTMKKAGFKPLETNLRMTFIFERDAEGKLLIVHLHYSSPAIYNWEVDDTPPPPVASETPSAEGAPEGTAAAAQGPEDSVFYDIP